MATIDHECGCVIHEEIHYELPDQPTEYVVLFACDRHEYTPQGLQVERQQSTIHTKEQA